MTTSVNNNTTNTTTNSTTNSSSSSSANSSLDQLAGNFNSFLTLLTTQLQNQDPLSPLDTNQFTQQLVEFASVQQQVDMNSNMQTLISLQQTSEAASAMQMVGSTVTLNGTSASLTSSAPATWTLNSASPATGNVTITNSSGTTVFTGTTPLNTGSNTYTWNGTGNTGQTWPAGQYTITVTATGASGQAVTVTPQVSGTVTGVDLTQNPPKLFVGGQDYAMSAVQSVTNSTLGGLSTGLNSLNTALSTLNSIL
ncbi:MAG TPA: flagellar hook capping FlgD N-terminal domain-containing protein [Xanthobacteraceae bacterium]|jgi:flagellar basal-body rod modification protein FlgD|nr:flagellar hook capping FlgD N-terminal domain-containing protein [Xanthobacteraceae bacterium]